MKKELQDFVKLELSKHEYPREIEFVEEIPKTVGGKINRREIKNWAQSESRQRIFADRYSGLE